MAAMAVPVIETMAALANAGALVIVATVTWAVLGAIARVMLVKLYDDADAAEFGYILAAILIVMVLAFICSEWLAAIIFAAEIGGLYWLAGKV